MENQPALIHSKMDTALPHDDWAAPPYIRGLRRALSAIGLQGFFKVVGVPLPDGSTASWVCHRWRRAPPSTPTPRLDFVPSTIPITWRDER